MWTELLYILFKKTCTWNDLYNANLYFCIYKLMLVHIFFTKYYIFFHHIPWNLIMDRPMGSKWKCIYFVFFSDVLIALCVCVCIYTYRGKRIMNKLNTNAIFFLTQACKAAIILTPNTFQSCSVKSSLSISCFLLYEQDLQNLF